MHTQIFKQTLLEIEYNKQSIKDFAQVCRQHYIGNTIKLDNIDDFESSYCPESSIWWYTKEYFIYGILNRALRNLETNTIISMAFFICDLHREIEYLHQQQIGDYHGQVIVVYRGQGLSTTDFQKLLNTKGGLMSFNHFLSTSKDKQISLIYAESASMETGMIGILFKMTIDPSISSSPFVSIQEFNQFKEEEEEEEILFSMHTVFRVVEITKINNNSALYQVELQLTADDDQQLRTFTKYVCQELAGWTGWVRLSALLIKIGQFDSAEELCKVLLDQATDEAEETFYCNSLGYIMVNQGDSEAAISFYEKALKIREKTHPAHHSDLAIFYNNIGLLYTDTGDFLKAVLYHVSALRIRQITLPSNHPALASTYNNIASLYKDMGKLSDALSYYTSSLEMCQHALPSNHHQLAGLHVNIASIHVIVRELSKANLHIEKAIEIIQNTYSSNAVILYNSYIASVYNKMGDFSNAPIYNVKALSYHEKALEVLNTSSPLDHSRLTTSYSNIALVYIELRELGKAVFFL